MTTQNNTAPKNKPIHKLSQRVNYGFINLAIWQKELVNPNTGEVTLQFSVTTQKSYKKEGVYKNTTFIDGDDISVLTDLLKDARRWIRDAKQAFLEHKVQTGTQVNPGTRPEPSPQVAPAQQQAA